MPIRHLPNEPNLEHLKGQAKALLAAFQSYDPITLSDFHEFHPREVAPDDAKLNDGQVVLARAYQQTSWPWLRIKVDLLLAILNHDVAAVRDLVTANPDLMTETVRNDNWGPPMSQAANLGRGADQSVRASICKKLAFIDEAEHRYRDVTALEYGRAFHEERFVDKTALTVLEQF